MTNELTIRPPIELRARRGHSMPRPVREMPAAKRARFDFDAALLALIFACQFAVIAAGVGAAFGNEPHVGAPAVVVAAHGPRAP